MSYGLPLSFSEKIKRFLSNRAEIKEHNQGVGITSSITQPIIDATQGVNITINKDTIIRNKFFSGYPRSKDVIWFVIHGTAGGGVLHWMRYGVPLNSARGIDYQKGIGLFHYLINRDGSIWEIIDPDKWVWHASIGRVDGGTIGVELVNTSTSNSAPYTQEQYNSLIALYTFLRTTKFPKMTTMISHNRAMIKVNEGRYGGKACPGRGFNWHTWRNMVRTKYSFAHENGESLWNIQPIS